MIRIIVVSLLCVAGVLCFVFAWISGARHTRELDRIGVIFRCKRWPDENNRSYHQRLRARLGRP
jgi:hypothetical protein